MSTKPMLTAVERYLATQTEHENSVDAMAESAANETRRQRAQKELEQEAGADNPRGGIRRILVAVDHVHHMALKTALDIAQPLRAQVAIVYVLEPLPAPNLEMAYDMASAYDEIRAGAVSMLAEFEKEVPHNALAFTLLREGRAADEIVAAAKDFGADLIILGTHRRGALARFFMGSTSQAVLRSAHCPVMFVLDDPAAQQSRVLQAV